MSKQSSQNNAEEATPNIKEIRDSMMQLASKLSKKNMLKAYREKMLESFENGDHNEDDDELVNSEDFMVEEGEEEEEGDQGLPAGLDIGAIMQNLTGAIAGTQEEGGDEGEAPGNPMDMIKNMMASMMGGMPDQPGEEGEEGEEEGEGEEESEEYSDDGLNSEERAELEQMQAEGFNPMEKFNSLLQGLNGAPVAAEGEESKVINNIINGEVPAEQATQPVAEEEPELYSITNVVLDYGDKKMASKTLEELNTMLGADTEDDQLLAIFSLLKLVENNKDVTLRENIFKLSNFNNVINILENREDFGLYTVKFLYFLVGKGENAPFRAKFIELFRKAIFKAFTSFDMTQVTFALDLTVRCLLVPGEGVTLNTELDVPNSYLITLLFKIGQIDATKSTEPLKVIAIQYRAYNQVLQLVDAKNYPLFAEKWLSLSLKAMDIGKVYYFRFEDYQTWLGEHPEVQFTILASESLRTVILEQCKKVPGIIYMLLQIWQKSEENGRGAQLFEMIPGLREEVAFRDIVAVPDSSM